jgi:hypothetical protein
MRINELYQSHQYSREIQVLRTSCTQFLKESSGTPIFKNLSTEYGDFHKVKVRKRKGETGDFTETFNEAFELQHPGLRQRAIFANGATSFQPLYDGVMEPYYVFPIDGYKFMYSREVENSGQEYKQVFDTLFEQFGEEKGNEVLTDLLRFTYTSQNLHEGIVSGSEIIIYGIPFFYAIRSSVIENYQDLLSTIIT